MTRLFQLLAVSGLLLASVGCCCSRGAGYGACYPPADPCPGGACGVGAVSAPGVAQRNFYSANGTAQAGSTVTTTSGPVALGPIIPGPVSYSVPTTTTTYYSTPLTTTTALQPLPTY